MPWVGYLLDLTARQLSWIFLRSMFWTPSYLLAVWRLHWTLQNKLSQLWKRMSSTASFRICSLDVLQRFELFGLIRQPCNYSHSQHFFFWFKTGVWIGEYYSRKFDNQGKFGSRFFRLPKEPETCGQCRHYRQQQPATSHFGQFANLWSHLDIE